MEPRPPALMESNYNLQFGCWASIWKLFSSLTLIFRFRSLFLFLAPSTNEYFIAIYNDVRNLTHCSHRALELLPLLLVVSFMFASNKTKCFCSFSILLAMFGLLGICGTSKNTTINEKATRAETKSENCCQLLLLQGQLKRATKQDQIKVEKQTKRSAKKKEEITKHKVIKVTFLQVYVERWKQTLSDYDDVDEWATKTGNVKAKTQIQF